MSEAIKLWLDDRREPPDLGWTWVKTPGEAIRLLEGGEVDEISFDHDLGYDDEGLEMTGYSVALWIEEAVVLRGFEPPEMFVHSANPPGHERLLRAIESIRRRIEQ